MSLKRSAYRPLCNLAKMPPNLYKYQLYPFIVFPGLFGLVVSARIRPANLRKEPLKIRWASLWPVCQILEVEKIWLNIWDRLIVGWRRSQYVGICAGLPILFISMVQPWCNLCGNYRINGPSRHFSPHICHSVDIVDPHIQGGQNFYWLLISRL